MPVHSSFNNFPSLGEQRNLNSEFAICTIGKAAALRERSLTIPLYPYSNQNFYLSSSPCIMINLALSSSYRPLTTYS